MKTLFVSLSLILFEVSEAALPKCSYDVCTNGGLWSEWTSTEKCPTDCGSCAKRLYTRTCLSTNFPNCACKGESVRKILCNTHVCVYPAQRTCCIPYVPMTINKTSQCGPLPKDKLLSSEAPCCPKDGFWSQWSGYIRDESGGWKRSRKCLSDSAGCPCDNPTNNVEISKECPCKKMVDVTNMVADTHATFPLNVQYNDTSCTAFQTMEHYNDQNKKVVPCNRWGNGKYLWANLIRYVLPNNTRREERIQDCVSNGPKQVTFYCDLVSEYWRLDANNEEVVGFNQINII
ncbi:hypothetical protein L3Y34_003826 [Caenorhabditis briggsae]|uniref:Uncharacterized protein n=1 Tax=Caenorhabditis briggsae TaxID=6238 RepID=A0AAE9ACB1_CAEBR|nr:hypothetical protein L3Y34_003826 [Caenorhabditis briggsae]